MPVVLNHIDVVGGGQEAGEGGRLGVPQRRRNDAWVRLVPHVVDMHIAGRRTILGEDVQALLHAQGRVEDDQAVADG